MKAAIPPWRGGGGNSTTTMGQSVKSILGFVVFIVACGLLGWYIYNGTKAEQSSIDKYTKQVEIIDSGILTAQSTQQLFDQVDKLNVNGKFPLSVSPLDLRTEKPEDKPDPFLNY